MKLKQLHHEKCPSCGARVTYEEQTQQHCNGQWFERQRFACGAEVKWVPNFSREEQSHACPNSQAEKDAKARVNTAAQKLAKYIRKSDFTKEEQDELFGRLQYAGTYDSYIFSK